MNTFALRARMTNFCLILALSLVSLGCQNTSAPTIAANPTPLGVFTGQSLPTEVLELEGIPLFSASEQLAKNVDYSGATYLLLAPQDPSKALLILEPNSEPSELAKRPSGPVKVTGSKELKKADGLLKHVKDTYQLDLQIAPSGEVVVLRVKEQ